MSHHARAAHISCCLSIADILAVLFNDTLNGPGLPHACAPEQRDRFILSKGQAAVAIYVTLNEFGILPDEDLAGCNADGSALMGQIASDAPGIEVSTGALGHGLPIGCGIALAARRDGAGHRTFVLLGDAECNEGSVWEGALLAAQHGLDNLVVLLDDNGMNAMGRTEQALAMEPLAEKWQTFGWAVQTVAGHDTEALRECLSTVPWAPGKPHCIVAKTVKGKGVSFMENEVVWHYRYPRAEEVERAAAELAPAS